MGKQLTITDPNSEQVYTLEFNRKSVIRALKSGFNPNELADGDLEAVLMIPTLFHCAFDMHHKGISEEETEAIYEMIPNKEDLIEALAELFADPINKLTEDPKGAKSKNFKWKKTW